MFVASYAKTMAGAKQFVEDRPIALGRPSSPGRTALSSVALPVKHREAMKIKRAPRPSPADRKAITPRDHIHRIIDLMARMHGTTFDRVMGVRKFRDIVEGRQAAMAAIWLNCQKPNGDRYTLPEIGKIFGRDHTTVLFALRKRGIARLPAQSVR